MGGFWQLSAFKSEMMGQPFEGRGATGYDPAKKKYVGNLGRVRLQMAQTLWGHAQDGHPTAIAVCEELLGATSFAAYQGGACPQELVAKLSSKD